MRTSGLVLTFGISLIFLAGITALVFLSGSFDAWDLSTAVWFNGQVVGSVVNDLLVSASLFGREYFWIGLLFVMGVAGDNETREMAIQLAGIFIVGIVAGEALKALLIRARPEGVILRVVPDANSSFPSGHALIVSIGATFALLSFRKKWLAGLLVIEALTVSVSRVYVGAHFPSDALAGIAAGVAIAAFGILLERKYLNDWIKKAVEAFARFVRAGPLRF